MSLSARELSMPPHLVYEERQRQRYINRANLPRRSDKVSLDDVSPRVREAVDEFLTEAKTGDASVGLLLWGRPGRGKTAAALAALIETLRTAPHEWLGRGLGKSIPDRPGYYLSYPEFLRAYKDSWSDDDEAAGARLLIKSLFCSMVVGDNARVLVLDDVGKEHHSGTGFNITVLHDLLRSRWDRDAPTILTTNVKPDEWEPQYGEAMASFIQEAFRIVEVKGPDRRAQ